MSACVKRIVAALAKNTQCQKKLTLNGAMAAFVAYDGKRFKPAGDPANELTTEEKVQLLVGIHEKRWNFLEETRSLKDSLHDLRSAELTHVDVSALSDAECRTALPMALSLARKYELGFAAEASQSQYFCEQLEAIRQTCDDVSDATSKLEAQLEELEKAIAELQSEYSDLKKRRECRSEQ
ncbi:hypothetical protein AAVH_31992 [Aphelenchoides avenae]|nr:hypothetical protein AAVH_31992 [Aphelenchus avenae]